MPLNITATSQAATFKNTVKNLSGFHRNHVWWWIAFILYELSIVLVAHEQVMIIKTLSYYAVNICLFYVHVGLLNAFYKAHKRLLALTGGICLELIIFMIIKFLLDHHFNSDQVWPGHHLQELLALNIYRIIFFIGLASLFWASSSLSDYERKMIRAEISKLEAKAGASALESRLAKAETALLRQQVSPHLLFNALNFIHNAVFRLSSKAAEMIILLTDTLRYSLEYSHADQKVTVQEEIRQIRNLIMVNDLRAGGSLPIQLTAIGRFEDFETIPFVMLTLVENIIKHGDQSVNPARITIEISDKGKLTFFSRNDCKRTGSHKRLKSTGLINLRFRLDHFYDGQYQLITEPDKDQFITRLTLDL